MSKTSNEALREMSKKVSEISAKEIGLMNEGRVFKYIMENILSGRDPNDLKQNVTLFGLSTECSQELDFTFDKIVGEIKTGGFTALLQNIFQKLEALKHDCVRTPIGELDLTQIEQLQYYLCEPFSREKLREDFKIMLMIFLGSLVKDVAEGKAVFPEGTIINEKCLILPQTEETLAMFCGFWSILTDILDNGFLKVFFMDKEDTCNDMTEVIREELRIFFSSPLRFQVDANTAVRTFANLLLLKCPSAERGNVELTIKNGTKKIVFSKLPDVIKEALVTFLAASGVLPEGFSPLEFLYGQEPIKALSEKQKVIAPEHPAKLLAEMIDSGITLPVVIREYLLSRLQPVITESASVPLSGAVTNIPVPLNFSTRVTVIGNGENVAQIKTPTQMFTTAKGITTSPFITKCTKGKPDFKSKVVLSHVKTSDDIVFELRDGVITFISGVSNIEEVITLDDSSSVTIEAIGPEVRYEALI
jgi:hypothetical protein